MISDERAKVDSSWTRNDATRQALEDIRADLVAAAADRWTEMHGDLTSRHSARREQVERALDDTIGSPSPSRVQQSARARRVGKEDRNAVGDRHSHRGAAFEREMAIGVVAPKPPLPTGSVHNDARSVHLLRCREPRAAGREVQAQAIPPRHYVSHWLIARNPEAASGPRCRERAHAERLELANGLVPGHRCVRPTLGQPAHFLRSSTRVIRAPRAFKRSSIRS
jgi:hypothetical protein